MPAGRGGRTILYAFMYVTYLHALTRNGGETLCLHYERTILRSRISFVGREKSGFLIKAGRARYQHTLKPGDN